jgi:hypothetical protein
MAEGFFIPGSVLEHEWRVGAHEFALQCVVSITGDAKKMLAF